MLHNKIKSNDTSPYTSKPNLQSWSQEIDIMIKKDNISDEDIFEAILYTQENDFWKNIILNPQKLRHNFETISKQMCG